tara:strand:+ start:279 stop:599 length:321 start_codon:yes stop_codon:yes gene_type:complete
MSAQAEQVAERCVRATKAYRLSNRARDVALVAIMLLPEGDDPSYPQRIIAEYKKRNPKINPFFLYFLLPLLASLAARWIQKWILNRKDSISRLRAEAFDIIDSQSS